MQSIEYNDDTTQPTYYYRDKFGNISLFSSVQHGLDVIKESTYDDEGNQTELTFSIEDLGIVQAYEYDYTDEPDSILSSITLPIENMHQSINTDHLGRPQKVQLINNSVVNSPVTLQNITTSSTQPLHYLFSTSYDYLKRGDHTSNLVSNVRYGLDDKYTDYISYKYDDRGNITEVYENNLLVCRYFYDGLSRLIREDNKLFGKTYTWTYDAGGNILNRFEYEFTLRDELRDKTPTIIPYTYSNDFTSLFLTNRGYTDQLMAYNGQTFTYDTLGNPTTYKGVNLTWSRGRQLVSYGDKASYTYNVSGIRTSKQVGNTTTNYFLDGTRILAQVDTVTGVDDTMVTTTTEYIYGADGITGFVLEGIPYYYKKNLQGDIIAILDKDLQIVTKYAYDAWGNFRIYCYNGTKFIDMTDESSYTDTDATEIALSNRYIAIKNPFRYRGYYYDVETNLYYLNSRYYDPEIGRFITIDDISVISDYMNTFNGLNLYAYCINNPIMYRDESGRGIFDWILGVVIVIAAVTLSIATAGIGTAIAGALGGGVMASVIGGAVGGAISGAILNAGISIAVQGVSAGFNSINLGQVGIDGLLGAVTGFVMGGLFALGGRALGLLGKTKWAQRPIDFTRSKNYFFGSASGNFTFFKYGKSFRLEASIQHGIHTHYQTIKNGIVVIGRSKPRITLVNSVWNNLVGFITASVILEIRNK